MEKIKELFSIPIGLKLIHTVDGQKFYSSDNLKNRYLEGIKKSKYGEKYYPEISTLVEKGLITPCYLNKGIVGLLAHKMFKGEEDKSIMGFYHTIRKDIFVLIDNSINPFGYSSNELLFSTTLHECMHLSFGRNNNGFIKLFKKELITFYSSYFIKLFKLNIAPTNIEKIILFIANTEKNLANISNKRLLEFKILLENSFKDITNLSEEKFQKTLLDLIVVLKIYLINFGTFIRSYKKYIYIFTPLNYAYQKTFGSSNEYTTPFQELISISEVICVGSEIKTSYGKFKQALKIV